MTYTNHLDAIQELHEIEINDTYDKAFRNGYAEAIRVVRSAVEGKAYSRSLRSLLTRVHNEFKAIF